MTATPLSRTATSPPGGVALSCAILIAVMLLAFAAIASWTVSSYGNDGLWSALIGWLLCTTAALIALLVSATFAGTELAMSANLGVMLIRMGAPLLGLTLLPQQFPHLAEAGLTQSILILYLVALAAETMLALRHVVKTSGAEGVSGRRLEAK